MDENQKKLIELLKASVFTEASLKPQALSLKKDDSNYGSTGLRVFGSNEPLSPNPSHLSPELLTLAKKHSVLPTISPDYEAVSKSDNQLYAADEMQSYFEQHGIYNCALKGINTKRRYPKPELRPMSDLDLLYKPEQTKQLRAAMKELDYKFDAEERRHDYFTRQPYICVEMHRIMTEPGPYYDYYKDPWSRFVLKPGCQYTYEMKLEDEFIYCIVHAAEHFKLGGVGIRVILDFAIYLSSARRLRHRLNETGELDAQQTEGEKPFDFNYFNAELEKLGLSTFYKKLSAIAEKWFLNSKPSPFGEGGSAEPDRVCPEGNTCPQARGGSAEPDRGLEDFILESGLYGTEENNNAARVGNSKAKFITSALFPSYESMCSVYQWLKGNKALLPIAWAERGTKALLHRRENIKSEFSRARKANKAPVELNQLFKELEI